MDWNIFGHDWAVNLLKAHIVNQHIRQAYVFTGPQGIGRRTLALAFAQALNCQEAPQPGIPCLDCTTCRKIQSMTHPDLHIVEAEKVGGVLKVNQIRELQHNLALTPYEARYRFAVLLRFEEAHNSTSNALLKTLEEPNPQVIIVLTASSTDNLLDTITSRSEVIRLQTLPVDVIKHNLIKHQKLSAEDANLFAHLSNGRPGLAINLSQDKEKFNYRQDCIDELLHLISSNRNIRFDFADTAAKDKENLYETLVVWTSFWRDVLLVVSGSKVPLTNINYRPNIEHLASLIGFNEVFSILTQTENTLKLITRNINPRLATEVLLLDYPKTHVTVNG